MRSPGRWAVRAGVLALVAALALPLMVSAQTTTQFRATLTGANEVPAVTTNATGTFTATLDETAGTLQWSLSVPTITNATAAHLHSGAAGANGPIVVNLYAPAAGTAPVGTISVSGTARAADVIGPLAGNFAGLVSALKAGTIYANVHTQANAGGEIRAQVTTATPTATPTATAAATATATAKAATATPTPAAAIAPPKSGTGGYLDGANSTLVWMLGGLAVVAGVTALAASRRPGRRQE